MDPDDSPWHNNAESLRDTEWSKISSDFLNAGYREGITAGKESALQEGFDEGFAQTGVPVGHRIGLYRGAAAAMFAVLSSRGLADADSRAALDEARTVSAALGDIRFADIVPPDVQAEEHAKENMNAAEETALPGALQEKHGGLEGRMPRMPSDAGRAAHRSAMEDAEMLFSRVQLLADTLGLSCPAIQ